MTLQVSKLCSVHDRLINEHGAVSGLELAEETKVLEEHLPQSHTVDPKTNMT